MDFVPLDCQNAKGNVMDANYPLHGGVCNGLNPLLGSLRFIRKYTEGKKLSN